MQSEDTKEIAAALAKAQASMKNAPKNARNPHLKNKYADLASVRDTVIPPLSANGIAVIQTFRAADPGCVLLVTTLLHSSGQWVSSELSMPVPDAGKQNPAQVLGSVISYARRYSLSAICGISADDDDDAESAGRAPDAPQSTQQVAADPISVAKRMIVEAGSLEQLEVLGARLNKSKDEQLKAAVMGVYAERLKVLKSEAAE